MVAIVAARTTLHGVKLSLAATQEKTAAELKHSVDQEHRNREHTRTEAENERNLSTQKDRHARLTAMRREVYLNAVSEFINFQVLLGSLVQKELTKLDVSTEVHGISLATYRVTLVGEQATVVIARQTLNAFMRLFIQSLSAAMPMAAIDADIAALEALKLQSIERGQTYVEAMRQFNLTQRNDQRAFDGIRAQYDIASKETHGFTEKLENLYFEKTKLQISYGEFIHAAIRSDILSRIDALIIAIRDELELSSEPEVFTALSNAAYDEATAAFDNLKKQLT